MITSEWQFKQESFIKLELNRWRTMTYGNPEIIREVRGLFTVSGILANRRVAPIQLTFENCWINKP